MERLFVEDSASLTGVDIADRDLATLALALRLFIQAHDIELTVHTLLHFALKCDSLQFIDLVEFFRDAKLVANFEGPEDFSNADWNSESPQVLQIHVELVLQT